MLEKVNCLSYSLNFFDRWASGDGESISYDFNLYLAYYDYDSGAKYD